jgi:hypothetical protein
MSDLLSSNAPPERGKRHPLLYHQRLSEQYFWPAALTVAASTVLLVWAPAKLEPYRLVLTMALACCGLVLVLTLLFRLRAYALCTAHGVRVRLPFYHFDIPYSEIKNIRPTELYRLFPPGEQRWPQRRFLTPLLGTTVLVIELDELPNRTAWLRLWMNKYMLCPDRVGVIVAVRDWMGFRAELDEFRARRQQLRLLSR